MRAIRALLIFLIGAVLSLTITYFAVIRPRIRSWGVEPGEDELPLPGDDLVSEATATETRGITIAAPPERVWPWLVQMGFGRAGWYSYDMLDNKGPSATEIMPEFQALKPGDVMPTHPGGGFLVKAVQAEHALVLYSDTELVRTQAEQAQAAGRTELPTPGLRATGALATASLPEFAASWGFYLQPAGDGETRLIERFRARTPGSGPAQAVLGEIMGTGIVLMTRKQLEGIKERVEQRTSSPAEPGASEDWPRTSDVEPETAAVTA
jgi:hypothetical protein